MNRFSSDLVQGMKEAAAFAEGRKVDASVHVVEVPDVRAIRRQLHTSQQRFAATLRIPLPTLKKLGAGTPRTRRGGGRLFACDRPASQGPRGSAAARMTTHRHSPLTCSFGDPVRKRTAGDPALGDALPREGTATMLAGDLNTRKTIPRD
jgi:hypothetical protein